MHDYLTRSLEPQLAQDLELFPAVALLGPRQVGKTTLARRVVQERERAVYLDLERPSDLARLRDPERFLARHQDDLVCIDEVQLRPDLFGVLRALIDDHRRPGRFLLLGSASPELIRQGSESLAGRLSMLELTPFLLGELQDHAGVDRLWLRGGFPESALATTDHASARWRQQFVRTFLERDLPQLGFRTPATTLRRFWQMCGHLQGQVLNLSALGRSMGVSHTTVRNYVDILEHTYVLRTLPPLVANLGKRLVKSPKLYVRDSGLLHILLGLETHDELAGHPVYGASWEGLVVEQLMATLPGWDACYYRTSNGTELDLVLSRGGRRIGVECKASSSPKVARGFWTALDDLELTEAWVVAPVRGSWPLGEQAEVMDLEEAVGRATALAER